MGKVDGVMALSLYSNLSMVLSEGTKKYEIVDRGARWVFQGTCIGFIRTNYVPVGI